MRYSIASHSYVVKKAISTFCKKMIKFLINLLLIETVLFVSPFFKKRLFLSFLWLRDSPCAIKNK